MTPRKEVELFNRIKHLEEMVRTLTELVHPYLPKHDNFLTVCQAAKKMNCCEAQVTKMCRNGQLPFATKVGKKWMIPEAQLIRFIGNIG